MKTNNFNLELMVPSQANKDVTFNETILKLDEFSNMTVKGLIDEVPESIEPGEKYIITKGEHCYKICYRPHESKPVLLQQPFLGMILYLEEQSRFIRFVPKGWQACSTSTSNSKVAGSSYSSKAEFIGIADKYLLPQEKFHYLYLDKSAKIFAKNLPFRKINLIIKQSVNQINRIFWGENILWSNNKPYQAGRVNSIGFVTLYSLPETDHYIGTISAENINY